MNNKVLKLKYDRELRVEVINPNTQKARYYIKRYYESDICSVEIAYDRPSHRKINIENGILDIMYSVGGHYYKIIGYNTSIFSCGYIVKDIEDIVWLIVDTPSRRYGIECTEAKLNIEY